MFDDVGGCWMFLVLDQNWFSKDWLGQFKQFHLYAAMFDDVGPALLDPVYLYLNISAVVVILLTVHFQCSSRPFS